MLDRDDLELYDVEVEVAFVERLRGMVALRLGRGAGRPDGRRRGPRPRAAGGLSARRRRRVRSAETWFLEHGLPYFVDDVRADVRRRLSRPRLVLVLAVALLAGRPPGSAWGSLSDSGSFGFAVGAWVVAGVAAAYALFALRMHDIAGWALRRAFASLGLLFPLATRALPMLLSS